MRTQVTEAEIISALSYYMRDYSAVRDGYALPREASVLGDVLGQMSFENLREYPWNLLTDEQARLLRVVFDDASTFPLL